MIEKFLQKIKNKNVEWEVFELKTKTQTYEFFNSNLERIEIDKNEKIGIRVLKDKKIGFSVCENENEVANAIKIAIKNAKISEKIDFEFKFSEKMKDSFKRVYEIDESIVKELFDVLKNFRIKNQVSFSYILEEKRIINSNGVDCIHKQSTFLFDVSVTLKNHKKHVNAFSHFFHFKPFINFEEKMLEAEKYAKDLLKAKKEKSKINSIVFHPFQLASLFSYTLIPSFFADNIQNGFSYFSVNKNLSSKISIIESPLKKDYFFVKFDEEGNKFKKKFIIKNGKLINPLYDLFHGLKEGKKPSNCFRKGLKPSIDITTLRFKFKKDILEKNLIGNVDKGVLLVFSLGTFLSNMATGEFSVKVFLGYKIENGEISYPITGNMVSGNIYEILSSDFIVSKELMKAGSIGCSSFFGKREQYLPFLLTKNISFK